MNLVENEPERYGRALLKHIERERMVDRTNWMVLLLLRIKSHTLGSLDERVSTIFNGEWLETDFGSTDYEVNWTWIRLREIQPDHIFFPPEKKRNSNIFESFGEEQRRLREEREERKTRELAVSLQIKRGILPEEFVNPVVRPIYQWKSRKVQVDVRYSKGNIKELLDRLNEYMKLLDLDFLDGIMAPFRVFSPEVANKLFKNILTLLSDEQLNQSLPKAWKVKEFSRWLQMGMKMVTDPTLFESLAKLWIEINLVKEGSGLQLVANQENSRAILQFAFDSLERNPTNLIKITNESPAQYRLGLILSILRSWYEGKNEDQSKPKLLAWKPEVLARVSKLADLMKSQLQVAGISVEAKNDLHSSVNQL
ncbi:MAG: hypothetical protein KDD35_12595, partial [Bdellovibrionales bacterium]|nr:hypothetical protein [Bdellovibrionales bacterium]